MKTALLTILLCAPCLSGCGARGSVRVSVPEVQADDEPDDYSGAVEAEDETPTKQELGQAIIEALKELKGEK